MSSTVSSLQGPGFEFACWIFSQSAPASSHGHAVSGVRLMMILKFPTGVDMSVNDCLSLYVSP